ncbi:MAG: DUF2073 domain-containing protein [Candidatus Thermoplasmatota archaeon]|nr:DUF2073 domain-containing protein [Candidatus Thermoplasmatota archaeon]
MTKKDNGISFNLVSRQKLGNLTSAEKLNFILKEVKKGKILVLEEGLTPIEQTSLIECTMREIEQDTFIGVEMEGYGEDAPTFLQKLLGVGRGPRMTLIGPANLLKTVRKDSNMIQTKIISGRGAR